jgi:hypothetical protein
MTASFELLLPNDDEGHSLGSFEAEALPRKGDLVYVLGKEVTGKEDNGGYPLECVVEDVLWEVFVDEDHERNQVLGPRVFLSVKGAAPTIYCTCTDEERERLRNAYLEQEAAGSPSKACEDRDGDCFNCGHARPRGGRGR